MPRFRTLACLLLLAALCAHALALGAAAGQARTAPPTQIVLCGSDGPLVIAIDASGRPVEPGRDCPQSLCPDCLSGAAFALPVAALPLPTPCARRAAAPACHRFGPLARSLPVPPARGPPSEA